MTVLKLIEALKKYDPDLVVTLADWNEEYAADSEYAAELFCISNGGYSGYYNGEYVEGMAGPHLVIGVNDV